MYVQEMSSVGENGNIVVDWSYAPADAQLYTPETGDNLEAFLKFEGGDAYCYVPCMGMTGWRLEGVRSNDEILNDKNMIKKEMV